MIFETFMGFFSRVFCFTAFVGNKSSFPTPLSIDEENELIELAHSGDKSARETLIKRNLRLVAHIVKKYSGAGEADDLISVGSIGLVKAIESFNPVKGSRLATYASKCIDNEILMYIRANKKHRSVVSLSSSVGQDKDGNEITLMEVLPADESCDPSILAENSVAMENVRRTIEQNLTEREKLIVKMRYGIGGYDTYTQLQIASILDISRSYVSRIEKKAIGKLRRALSKK